MVFSYKMYTFKLYRLPSIPRNEVLKYMNPIELLSLSQTSKKSTYLVQNLVKKPSIHLKVYSNLGEEMSVSFGNSTILKVKEIGNTKEYSDWKCLDGTVISTDADRNKENTTVYWNNEIDGLRKTIEIFAEILCAKSVSFTFKKYDGVLLKTMSDCSKEMGLKVEKVIFLKNSVANYDEYFYAFRWFGHNVSRLEMYQNAYYLSRNIQLDYFQISLNHLYIEDSSWICLEKLYSFVNCISIRFKRLQLVSYEFNAFLNKWIWGKFKLKHFEIMEVPPNHFHRGIVFNCTDAVMIEKPPMDIGVSRQFEPRECYSIQRKDGVKATICYFEERFIFKTNE